MESICVSNEEYVTIFILTVREDIKYLDYRRKTHILFENVSESLNVENKLVFIDFSGSRIGDEGACLVNKASSMIKFFNFIFFQN